MELGQQIAPVFSQDPQYTGWWSEFIWICGGTARTGWSERKGKLEVKGDGEAGKDITGSCTEPEQEQSRSGGASQGQPQPLDKSTVMRQAHGQARKLIQQVRGRGSEVQGPAQHPYSARKCRSQDRTLRVHERRFLAALSLNLAVFVELSSKDMQHHHIRADLTRSILYSVKMKEILMILFPRCRQGEVLRFLCLLMKGLGLCPLLSMVIWSSEVLSRKLSLFYCLVWMWIVIKTMALSFY